MARNVFVSFRFSDGINYKEEICNLFNSCDDVIDYSEDEDRSDMSEETIRDYLYKKLKRTSITVVILTPNAVNYNKNWVGGYDDWMYDELRYSLEEREGNATNAVIAVYTDEAKDMLMSTEKHKCSLCNSESSVTSLSNAKNLVRKNMCNVKSQYKKHNCTNIYDSLEDSYISLVSIEDFKNDINKYLDNAISKRERKDEFNISKQM